MWIFFIGVWIGKVYDLVGVVGVDMGIDYCVVGGGVVVGIEV